MRAMLKNKRSVWYATYTGKTETMDGNYHTGQYTPSYSNPVKVTINVLPPKGETIARPFGVEPYYDRAAVIGSRNTPINENSIMWIDVTPVIGLDGSTSTPHDYVVSKVSHSLNETTLSLKRVDVS